MPSEFDALLKDLDAFTTNKLISDADRRELEKRRSRDGEILKALHNAGQIIREQHELQTRMKRLKARSVARGQARTQAADNERNRLAKSIEMGTAMLKAAVNEGRLSAVEACKYEAAIHRLNEQLGAMS